MGIRSVWKRGVATAASLLVLVPSLLMPMTGMTVSAAEDLTPRVATPSAGMDSMDKIVYTANAVDFGADNTGNQDATQAIQTAIDRVNDKWGGVVFLPAGRYRVEGTLNIPGGVTLRGEWLNPDEGGLGKGTILMAYAGKGVSDPTENPFITIKSAGCLRDISIWYPEQDAANPVAYPATIYGESHTDVINVTLYNSYYGFYNNTCSSMLIRQMYGTVLYRGIHGAYAYDIPRIENVTFDTKYWANSGLAGAPSGSTLTSLNTYTENNLVAIQAGEQDWGYWFDLNINHAKYGILLTAVLDDPGAKVVPGNIAAGKVTTRNTKIGVYMENVGYPGFQLTHSDIEATEYGMYYTPKPDYSAYEDAGITVRYYENATIVISATQFSGGKAGFWSDKTGGYNINFNDCTFQNWSDYAIRMEDGSLTLSNSIVTGNKTPLYFAENTDQAVMLGNSFATSAVVTGDGWSDTDSRITRDDTSTDIPNTPDYDYTYVSDVEPATDKLFNVMDYGAVSGGDTKNPPSQDSSVAFQMALNAAKAAGGGTVYVPAGIYRLNSGVVVPTGVELRGSFESAHYGNGTYRGSHLYAFGDKGNVNGTPLITLEKGAGVKGFTVFYPEQGYSDTATEASQKVKAYPPTVRANQDTWVQNMAIIGCYTAVDAMSHNCDNIVITDVTGAALYASLELGHGTVGGYVQNLHFNYSGWVQQWAYANQPTGDDEDITTLNGILTEYTTRVVKGIILGDAKDVNFFSCFNILVAEQIVLEKDSYTGGDFEGVMWGVAFDAAMNGVVGRDGSDAELAIIASMGVFNRQSGGYNIVTKPGFTGRISLFNADAWDYRSKLVYVEGGTVDLVQFFSWCVHNGVCKKGATLNVLASTMISNNGDNSGTTPDYTYEQGAMGTVVGNLDCKQKLNVITQSGSMVDKRLNAAELAATSSSGVLTFSGFSDRDRTADNRGDTKKAMDTGWVTYDGGSADTGVDMSKSSASNLHLQMTVILTKTDCTDADEEVFSTGNVQIRSVDNNGECKRSWSVSGLNLKSGTNYLDLSLADARADTNDLSFSSINRVRIYVDSINRFSGLFTMQVRDAKVVDVSATTGEDVVYRANLGEMLSAQLTGDAVADYTEASITAYNQLFTTAKGVYDNPYATAEELLEQILLLNVAEDLLVKRDPVASAANRETLRQALNAVRSNSNLTGYTSASVKEYKALYTAARAVYNDVDATDAQILAQVDTLKTADALLEEYTAEVIPLLDASTNSGVAHYMNVAREYTESIDLTSYGQRVSTDIRIRVKVNKDDATFPSTVAPYSADEWLRYVRNGRIALWSGGYDNTYRYWVHEDLDCKASGNPMEAAVIGDYVEIYLPVPAEVIAAGRVDKFEIFLYNDLHNFMKEKDPNNADNYTEKNEGSNGLYITVESAELVLGAGVVANKTALDAAIQKAESVTDTAVYTPATAKAFVDALAAAKEVSANDDANQTQVDAAATALTVAQNGLIRLADKTALNNAIAAAEAITDTSVYTKESVQVFTGALDNAKAVAANEETTQTQVDLATKALIEAQEGLVGAVNKTALNNAISAAQAITDTSVYTTASRQAFAGALTAAKKVAADEDATQEEVDAAAEALIAAQTGLEKLADKTALQTAITQAMQVDTGLYTEETVAPFTTALSAARKLMIKAEATQTEVDAAIQALTTAKNGLEEKVTVLYGDVNADGEVTAEDALLALQIATGKVGFTAEQQTAGNVDGQETITAADALLILQHATKKIAAFPVEE